MMVARDTFPLIGRVSSLVVCWPKGSVGGDSRLGQQKKPLARGKSWQRAYRPAENKNSHHRHRLIKNRTGNGLSSCWRRWCSLIVVGLVPSFTVAVSPSLGGGCPILIRHRRGSSTLHNRPCKNKQQLSHHVCVFLGGHTHAPLPPPSGEWLPSGNGSDHYHHLHIIISWINHWHRYSLQKRWQLGRPTALTIEGEIKLERGHAVLVRLERRDPPHVIWFLLKFNKNSTASNTTGFLLALL